jgi:hypothetical protein
VVLYEGVEQSRFAAALINNLIYRLLIIDGSIVIENNFALKTRNTEIVSCALLSRVHYN